MSVHDIGSWQKNLSFYDADQLRYCRSDNTGMSRLAEARSRSVRIRNLPPATQEGLLQQAMEKIAPVRRVEVFVDKQEAVVELENAAVCHMLRTVILRLISDDYRKLGNCCFVLNLCFLMAIHCRSRRKGATALPVAQPRLLLKPVVYLCRDELVCHVRVPGLETREQLRS